MIERAYIVPGQPHILLASEKNKGWASLKNTYEQIGKEIENAGAHPHTIFTWRFALWFVAGGDEGR